MRQYKNNLFIYNHLLSPFLRTQKVASFWKSISISREVNFLQAFLMAATLSSRKCCYDLSMVSLLTEDPSSLTLVLEEMMLPGRRSSFKYSWQTLVKVLENDLCWVLFCLIHLDSMFRAAMIKTVVLSFFSRSLTNFLQRVLNKTFWALNETYTNNAGLSFPMGISMTLLILMNDAILLFSPSQWLTASWTA